MAVVMVCHFGRSISKSSLNLPTAMAKASEVLPGSDPDAQVKEVKAWLKLKGVREFEPVSLFSDQLTKVCCYSVCTFHCAPT